MKEKLFGPRANGSIFLGALLIFACAVSGIANQKKKSSTSLGIFAQDRGKLNITKDGQIVGHEDFEISPSGAGWIAKGNAEIKPAEGAASKVSGSLTLQPDGTPVSYDWTAQTDKKNGADILFANGIANVTVEMEGARACTPDEIKDPNRKQPCFFEQSFSFSSPLVVVLDNNLYDQYGILARIYDWSKR
ncbi:MAG: hypothetical protein WA894_10925, partial [Candidatus Acidiferrum sp.]